MAEDKSSSEPPDIGFAEYVATIICWLGVCGHHKSYPNSTWWGPKRRTWKKAKEDVDSHNKRFHKEVEFAAVIHCPPPKP